MTEAESKRIVVVGASAAGLRAAARAKRLLPSAEVTVVDAGKFISYGACGMPYFVSGDIQGVGALMNTAWGTMRDADFFEEVKALKVLTGTVAEKIDPTRKTLQIKNIASGQTEELAYDDLVLATGANPIRLPGCAKDSNRVTCFKTLEEARFWRKSLEQGEIARVAIIGTGFIGLEMAEAFVSMWGIDVELIEAESQVFPIMSDPEIAALIEEELVANNVTVHTGNRVTDIRETEDGVEIVTDKQTINVDHAVMALGVRPAVELAKDAGIKLGETGGILVDDLMRTSAPNIFACGDCIEVTMFNGKKANLPLGSLANKQGRAVGNILAGRDDMFGAVAGNFCVKVFDLNVATTGFTAARADRWGVKYNAVWASLDDLAHYYPGNATLFMKMLYDPETEALLGLQAVGKGEVVKRVDVFGNLLINQGHIEDLFDLEFCYAPPYAPALDPLYFMGAIAMNQEQDDLKSIAPGSSFDGYLVVDVRSPEEAMARPLPCESINIPIEDFRAECDTVDKSKPALVVCAKGARSAEAARILMQAGHPDVVYLGGGSLMYRAR